MEILFKKILHNDVNFETEFENIKFFGIAKRESKDLVLCKGKLRGNILHTCDRCGEEFNLLVDEDLELFASDGIYEKDDSLDVIEFENGILNFETLLVSEVEAIKSDYHYCDNCNKI
jgi:uncharacterized metal-binding protein YceD (DUF177 family)